MLDLDAIFDPDQSMPTRRLMIALPEPPPAVSPWDLPDEWRERWEERAAIMEYDGKMPLERAEIFALGDILRQMKLANVPVPRIDN